jgi:hypothetical protein
MPTYYISNTESNGFAIGNDSNAGTSRTAPWLTASKFASTAVAGDLGLFNDGTYQHTGSLTPAAPLTYRGWNRGTAILQSTSGTNSTVLINLAATGSVFDGMVFDGGGTKAGCFTFDTGNDVAVSIVNCVLRNTTTHTLTATGRLKTLLFSGNTVSLIGTSGTTNNAINGVPTPAGSVWTITGNIFNVTAVPGATTATAAILLSSPSGVLTAVVSGNVINLIGTGAAGDVRGVYSEGLAAVTISNNRITYTGSKQNQFLGILTPNDAVDTSIVSVFGNEIDGTVFGENTNIGIMIGNNDLPAVSNKITLLRCDTNTVRNCNHGVMFGYVSGAKGYRNRVHNALVGLLLKTTTGGSGHFSSIVTGGNFNSGALRSRGDTNGFFMNNTVHCIGPAADTVPVMIDESPEAANAGTVFANNCITTEGTLTNYVLVAIGSAASYSANNYYGSASASTGPDTLATRVDPRYSGGARPTTPGGFKLRGDNNPLVRGWLDVGPLHDFGNRRFNPGKPSIGAWECGVRDVAA